MPTPVSSAHDDESKETELAEGAWPVREAVGELMHVAVQVRADIAQALSVCARQVSKPTSGTVNKIKRILKYLKGCPSRGIYYSA